MAVSNEQAPNLAPSYQNIIGQLQNRAGMEEKRSSPLDIGTAVVKRADQELSAKRLFEQKMASEGKTLVTDEGIDEFSKELGVDPAIFKKYKGLWMKPEDIQNFGEQELFANTFPDKQEQAAAKIAPKETAVLQMSSKFGKFDKNNLKIGKDESSSTGYSYYSIDDKTGKETKTNVEAPAPTAGTTNQQKKFLLNSFLKESKPFKDIASSYMKIRSSADKPSAAGDLSMIFSYMKILDPISVVREGEQATAENARGVPESIRALNNKVLSGTKLTPEQRADFLNRAKQIYDNEEQLHFQRENEYAKQAALAGLDPNEVTMELRPKFKSQTEFSSIEEAEKSGLPKGTEITINGRKAVLE